MCDYSLETVDQRKARSDELLVTTKLGEFSSIGLVSPNNPTTAVCLVSGMRARINVTASMSRDFKIPAGAAMATFTQRELPSKATGYRDGFVFDDSPDEQHLLQDFDLGVAIVPVGIDVAAEPTRELVDA
jgi:hypothetical protein